MNSYDDIINLPHHTSKKHPRMDRAMRACQFAPFSALTGHEEMVKETARLTDSVVELDEYEILKINEKLTEIMGKISQKPEICVTYFKPDDKKSGGEYVTLKERVKKVDQYGNVLVMSNDERIDIKSILDVEVVK